MVLSFIHLNKRMVIELEVSRRFMTLDFVMAVVSGARRVKLALSLFFSPPATFKERN